MKRAHIIQLAIFTVAVALVTVGFAVAMNARDCGAMVGCAARKASAVRMAIGLGIAIYLIVVIRVVREWSR